MATRLTMQQRVTPGWSANLKLRFTRPAGAGKTLLAQRRHTGPLQVQRPFYPEGPVCHVVILHPPGGIVGGDELATHIDLEPRAQALITTPAAGKFYRSIGAVALQTQTLNVSPGATLEWLPQESILFEGARVKTLTRVQLHGDARFLGWEILCLGRPAAHEGFARGWCRQRLELWRDSSPLYLETGRYQGGSEMLAAGWGLRQMPVTGTLIGVGEAPDLVAKIRASITSTADELFSISQLHDVLVCRYLGPCTAQARRLLQQVRDLLRPALLDIPSHTPRIWNT